MRVKLRQNAGECASKNRSARVWKKADIFRAGIVLSKIFDKYLARWRLVPDGNPIITPGSRLLPVRMGGTPAMLKMAIDAEEKFGGLLLKWWNGQGVAHVFAHEDDALLMERAEGPASLVDMARAGGDDEASRLICRVVARLHATRPRARPLPDLVPLAQRFGELEAAAARHGGIWPRAQ